MRIVLVLYVHKFGRQGACNVNSDAGYVEHFTLLHTQIWGLTPSFECQFVGSPNA